ncbi:ABC-three component system protein [Fibrella aquatica]|uniref:ABC-three component system protein n=1 Tax=Fibrella aquatica TaxID=3242487 RepID=UPI00351FC61B
MNNYPCEHLSADEFENLVIRICKEILGVGCKTFSPGRDGAKDSWFTGVAENYPSKVSPWKGTFNIQAKHTQLQDASCSDNDFYVNVSSVLSKEIKRLKEVMVTTRFDNYIIFTNRKLSGGAHTNIIKKLQTGTGLTNVEIIGKEEINTYLNDFPHIAQQFGLFKFAAPLRFFEKDLKDVIIFFGRNRKVLNSGIKSYASVFPIIDKVQKNKLNNLGEEYFDFIKTNSLQYFGEIEDFLREPKNEIYTNMYTNTVSDLQELIILERKRFNEFEHIIKHLVEYVVDSNRQELQSLRSLVRVFIHFMYFNCDIGRVQ